MASVGIGSSNLRHQLSTTQPSVEDTDRSVQVKELTSTANTGTTGAPEEISAGTGLIFQPQLLSTTQDTVEPGRVSARHVETTRYARKDKKDVPTDALVGIG